VKNGKGGSRQCFDKRKDISKSTKNLQKKIRNLTKKLKFKEGLLLEMKEGRMYHPRRCRTVEVGAQLSEDYFKKPSHEVWGDKYFYFSSRITS
jgi:hypothetical protein